MRHASARFRAITAFALIALAAGLAGCAKKTTAVDPSQTSLEGDPNGTAKLIVYPDLETFALRFLDFAPPGPGPEDQLASTDLGRAGVQGTYHGVIVDQSIAESFQVFRSEDGGGLRELKDFPVPPSTRLLDTGTALYAFDDPDPSRPTPAIYQARGTTADGRTSANAPVTNLASIGDSLIANLDCEIVPTGILIDTAFTVRWTPVAGAAGYWLQVFQYRSDLRTFEEQFLSTVPAPLFVGKSRDFYLAYIPAGTNQHTLFQPGATVYARRAPRFGQSYFVRLSAVDANNRMIAFSYGDLGVLSVDLGYLVYPLGALVVVPGPIAGPQRVTLPAPGGLPVSVLHIPGGSARAIAERNAAMVAARSGRAE